MDNFEYVKSYEPSCSEDLITLIVPHMEVQDLQAKIGHRFNLREIRRKKMGYPTKPVPVKKSVEKILRCVLSSVSELKTIPKQGMAIFSGLYCIYLVYPPRKIRKFEYHCGKKFVYEPIQDLFKKSEKTYGLIKTIGNKTTIQLFNEFVETKTMFVHVREKGEKDTDEYIARKASEIFGDIIFGILIVGRPEIQKKLGLSVYTMVRSDTSSIPKYIKEMILYENEQHNKKYISYLENIIQKTPDLLMFGEAEIKEGIESSIVKTVYTTKNYKEKYPCTCIILPNTFMEKYGGIIGEKYYTN